MNNSPVVLQFVKALPADPANSKVLTEHYVIVEKRSGEIAGSIRLRLADTDDIRLYAGHIGYRVEESFRGHHYAAYACLEVKPIAIRHGFAEVWITCNPDNWPSRRTCERIGAKLIEVVDLPEDNDMYLRKGERQKCRYRWQLV